MEKSVTRILAAAISGAVALCAAIGVAEAQVPDCVAAGACVVVADGVIRSSGMSHLAAQIRCQPGEIPDAACSPGVVASTDQSDVCGIVDGLSYSKRHRQTPEGLKQAIRKRYGAPAGDAEIDHIVPLSLGGQDSAYNLFWQPGHGQGYVWTYHEKDRLEVELWRRVCKEHTMSLQDAQAVFLQPDWRVGYCQYIGGPPCSVAEGRQ